MNAIAEMAIELEGDDFNSRCLRAFVRVPSGYILINGFFQPGPITVKPKAPLLSQVFDRLPCVEP